jgi:hypothetical protein
MAGGVERLDRDEFFTQNVPGATPGQEKTFINR